MMPFGEEPTDVMSSRFDEMMHVAFTVEYICFTRASDVAYAIVIDWLGEEMTIETPIRDDTAITNEWSTGPNSDLWLREHFDGILVGSGDPVTMEWIDRGVHIHLPNDSR